MTSCPSCQQSVEDDFGLATCSHCGHIFMVGQEEDSVSETSEEFSGAASQGVLEEEGDGEEILISLHSADEEAADEFTGDGAGSEKAPAPADAGFDPPWLDPMEEEVEPDPSAQGAAQTETQSFSEEMSEFAEKVPSSAELYEYQLKISGDGSQDILPNLRQVLRDVGLEELDLQMSPAREMVTLPWIGAVEAHRLVTQLRKFSVTIYWDQRHALKE